MTLNRPLDLIVGLISNYYLSGIESGGMLKSLRVYQKFFDEIDKTHDDDCCWLAGRDYTLADIDVIPCSWRLKNRQLAGAWQQMPRVQRWVDRVFAFDNVQKTIIEIMLPNRADYMKNGERAWSVIERLLQL